PRDERQVLARHRSPRGQRSSPMVEATQGIGPSGADPSSADRPGHPPSGTKARHRITAPSPAVRGRVVVAAVAAGAFLSAGQTMDKTAVTVSDDPTLVASAKNTSSAIGLGGAAPAPEFLPVTRPDAPASADAVQAMAKGQRLVDERIAREAEASRIR